MRENLGNHIEQQEMFKMARRMFDRGESATLGAAMADRKRGAQQDAAATS